MENYEIIKRLSKGACGELFLAKVKNTNNKANLMGYKSAVLKFLNITSQRRDVIEEINGEILTMQRLSCANQDSRYVVKYIDHFDTKYKRDFYRVIVMEDLTEWMNLNDFMLNLHKKDPHHIIDILSMKKIILNMIKGINYIHLNGLAHRDIKPENIMLDINCNIKFIDFGFSCPLFYNIIKGTPVYLPPETDFNRNRQSISNENLLYLAKKHDIWSLGIVIYKLANIKRYPNNYPFAYEQSFTLDTFFYYLRQPHLYHKSQYPNIPNNININYIVEKMLAPLPELRPSAHKILTYISNFV